MAALAAATVLLHVVTNAISPYGIHRDEFLYFAMGRHLRLFRMDFPPAIAILANIERFFSDSLIVLRSAPALAAAAIVVLAALIARELGGGRRAQILAAITVICSPVFMRPGNLFQPVVFDQLWWTLGLFALARLGNDDRPRWWVLLGVAGGLGLLTKFSILFFGFAVLVGLAVSPKRTALRTRWPWIAVALALAIGSPSVIGQVQLHFPIVGQMADLRQTQLGRVTVSAFVGTQLLYGAGTLIAAFGAAFFLVTPARSAFRHVAATCVAAFLLLLVLHGKPYYIAPIYPALYAAGWTAIESLPAPRVRPLVMGVATAGILIWGVLVFPLGYPVLSPPRMARYLERLGIKQAAETNRGTVLRIPQDYADMLGWEAQTRAVAAVFDSLTPDEQRTAAIAAGNYGEAGALQFYGPRYGLPPAVTNAGSFWYFGPGDRPGDPLVALGSDSADLARNWRTVTRVGRVINPWGVPEEQDVPIWVARGEKETVQALWPSLGGHQ